MAKLNSRILVKVSLLSLLERGPERYSSISKKLKRPDKTVYVTLKALAALKLVAKDEEGKYVLTDVGRRELKRMRLVSAVENEEDPEVVSLLFDLHAALLARKPRPQ